VYGHAFGDELLQQVTARIAGLIRQSDTFARIGGGEFVLLLEDAVNKNDIARMAEMILQALNSVFLIEETEIKATSSLEVATYPKDGATMDALLATADRDMYKAQEGQLGFYKF
jgi:diguanylate cyclase (GGDEF)-like protein